MLRVRLLGRRADLQAVLRSLQDVGAVQITVPAVEHPLLDSFDRPGSGQRKIRRLDGVLQTIEQILAGLGLSTRRVSPRFADRKQAADWIRLARRLRGRVADLTRRIDALRQEHALLAKYKDVLSAFQLLFDRTIIPESSASYCLILKHAADSVMQSLRTDLARLIGEGLQLRSRPLPSGETALLLVAPAARAQGLERILAKARVHEVPVPPSYGHRSLADVLPQMRAQLEAIPAELTALRSELQSVAKSHGDELLEARASLHDLHRVTEAGRLCRVTPHAFVIDGWLPARDETRLKHAFADRLDGPLVVDILAREAWEQAAAPVVLANPKLFRPFEAIVRFVPLPTYGSIDPTPFVAVFFPLFFGTILGDVGYGVVLLALAWVLRRRSAPETLLRSVSRMAGACGIFSMLFGLLYGELFGDAGARLLGLGPLWFHREEALLAFLALALAMGVVHVVLGLVLGAISAVRRHERHALGRGVSAVMVVLILVAILAAADVLTGAFFTPAIVAVLALFPVLVALEGILAPIEIIAALGNVFSYARIMALGTASVMMAIVANRMVGTMGSVLVGMLFALLFHLVNFVLGVFSPTIHALRLQYVEFFGKFYSPGGVPYQPLRHWKPGVEEPGPREE